jgi:hypothetical protein
MAKTSTQSDVATLDSLASRKRRNASHNSRLAARSLKADSRLPSRAALRIYEGTMRYIKNRVEKVAPSRSSACLRVQLGEIELEPANSVVAIS